MIVRLLIWCLLGFLAYTVFQALKQALKRPDAPPPEKTSKGEVMIQDPQCGTYVPRGDAVSAQVKGEQHYFCSDACRDQYIQKS